MNERQRFALEHPLNRADSYDLIAQLRATRKHATGLIIMTILAIDR